MSCCCCCFVVDNLVAFLVELCSCTCYATFNFIMSERQLMSSVPTSDSKKDDATSTSAAGTFSYLQPYARSKFGPVFYILVQTIV